MNLNMPEEIFVIEAEDVTASFCICILIACMLTAMFVFPRMTIIDSPFTQAQAPIVPELPMVGTRNPFAIKILNPDAASVRDGVKLLVKSLVGCELQSLWAVHCSSLQETLRDASLGLLRDPAGSLHGHFLHHGHPINLAAETETEISLSLPHSVTDTQIQASMGPPPRAKYPLCLVVRSLQGESWADSQLQIVGAVHIFHLPDETFPDGCRLISQLVISSSGQVCDLQKLFMATDGTQTSHYSTEPAAGNSNIEGALPNRVNTDSDAGSGERNSADHRDDSVDANDKLHGCVVCQNGPVSIALLPCRHTCVCSSCFPLLNKCPMCRRHFDSFFPLNCGIDGARDPMHYPADGAQDDEDDDWATKFNNYCERFNRWLGLDN
ncbi:cell growth regulator with RING finger domain protein 1-like [Patiria miniata]|uniref:RING-type domain-containing protein n=1 Tax=Patiria miniata TaxID=46514 RepID=A0A914B7N2_PATMI|nr:cell growth regulator with RING finger domain protein 1-like [Patiria miniata]